ncbi:YrdB family protein [Halocalculus aciditolerans]|uniref:DUF2568 domain-containing protein n=1 Tax=Halocalculus aciditolerans TaxID=1383812 RepID=A0A830FL15_9EURY|nr:YrdB family protein [Halocalculus aciditolerans]GGL63006.1 hypothetical protein GCM10009039_21160 [Halocalculus aciditolerans]
MSSESPSVSVALAARFLLELGALAALGYWGWVAGDTVASRAVLAAGAPLAAAVVWGAFVAPRARYRLADPARLLVELAVFGAATAGLSLAVSAAAAFAYAALVAVDEAWLAARGER